MKDNSQEIERLREELIKKVKEKSFNLSDKEVQVLSQKLDKLISEYMKK